MLYLYIEQLIESCATKHIHCSCLLPPEMASCPSNNLKSCTTSEDDMVTQVQQIDPDDPAVTQTPIPEQPAGEAAGFSAEGSDHPPGGPESEPPDDSRFSDIPAEVTPTAASDGQPAELPARRDSGTADGALSGDASDDASPLGADFPSEGDGAGGVSCAADTGSPPPPLTGLAGPELTDDVTGPERASDVTECGLQRLVEQQSVHARLQQAIDKVEQLDRSLEKKFKENLEARAVTADLQALIRRELAELGCRSGRHATREETDNTLHFLKVLVDNDSESDGSSQVSPIFQTQVRFGRGGRPAVPDTASHPATGNTHTAGDGPPPPHPEHDQYFIRRNIELAQEAGGSLAMTEEERCRLEQLLAEDEDPENAFSIDQDSRQLLHSLDDRLSSLGAAGSVPPGSSSAVSQLAGDGGAIGDAAADGGSDSELDYLQVTRQDRETSARLETLQRRLEQLAAPMEVRRLDRSDVDSMILDTISSLVSVPRASEVSWSASMTCCGAAEPGPADSEAGCSETSVPTTSERTTDGGASERPASEAPTEATLDVRSVLSGDRQGENERQLAGELRPGSPTAWLVDVNQGQQRFQLVVPRLSRQLISTLLESVSLQVPEQRPGSSGPGQQRPGSSVPGQQRPGSSGPGQQRPVSAGAD